MEAEVYVIYNIETDKYGCYIGTVRETEQDLWAWREHVDLGIDSRSTITGNLNNAISYIVARHVLLDGENIIAESHIKKLKVSMDQPGSYDTPAITRSIEALDEMFKDCRLVAINNNKVDHLASYNVDMQLWYENRERRVGVCRNAS